LLNIFERYRSCKHREDPDPYPAYGSGSGEMARIRNTAKRYLPTARISWKWSILVETMKKNKWGETIQEPLMDRMARELRSRLSQLFNF